jgi:general secretion pathway protein I
MSRQPGFTLLEVLVAMAFFAIAFAGISKAFGDLVINSDHLQTRTLAQWVADNQLAVLAIERSFPEPGQQSGSEDMAGRTWYWTRIVKNTPDKDVRRVILEVRTSEHSQEAPVAVLESYLGRN